MRNDLRPIYQFVVNQGVVTAKVLAVEFECSVNTVREKINELVERNYLKTDMVQNPITGQWVKVYKSPDFDHE